MQDNLITTCGDREADRQKDTEQLEVLLREVYNKGREDERSACVALCESQAPDISDLTKDEYRRGQKRAALGCASLIGRRRTLG